jgi:hypothetical protein
MYIKKITIYKIIKYEKLFNTFMYLLNNDYKVSEALEFMNELI